MHAVQRSPEPAIFAMLRASGINRYSQLNSDQRQQIRAALRGDFGEICAYCEKQCDENWRTNCVPEENGPENEHFRPDKEFPASSLEWLNLVYSCKRCNDVKGNFWPRRNIGTPDYDGFVNPNALGQQPGDCVQRLPAEDLFDFAEDVDRGLIKAAEDDSIQYLERAMAAVTIDYLDLNSDYENPSRRGTGLLLPEQRQVRAIALRNRLRSAWDTGDVGMMAAELNAAIQRDQPFSSYMRAYIKQVLDHEYPGIIRLIQEQ